MARVRSLAIASLVYHTEGDGRTLYGRGRYIPTRRSQSLRLFCKARSPSRRPWRACRAPTATARADRRPVPFVHVGPHESRSPFPLHLEQHEDESLRCFRAAGARPACRRLRPYAPCSSQGSASLCTTPGGSAPRSSESGWPARGEPQDVYSARQRSAASRPPSGVPRADD